jgi:chromosome segregation ATPase
MRLFESKYQSFLTLIALGIAISVMSFCASAEQAAKPEPGTDETQPETIVKKPELSEIIPLSTELAGRLTDLENKVKGKLDLDALGIKFSQIQAAIRKHELELQKFKDYGDYRTTKLITVRRKIQKDKERLDVVSKPLVKEIQRLDDMRKQWLTESEKWDAWESAWSKEEAPEQVKSVFADVKERITKAQDIIDPQVGTLLAEQEKIGAIQQKIQTLEGELDS